jgi:hypothetical protein
MVNFMYLFIFFYLIYKYLWYNVKG